MHWLNQQEGFEAITSFASKRTPFLFIVSYDTSKIFAQPLETLTSDVRYALDKVCNYTHVPPKRPYTLTKKPISFTTYQNALHHVQEEIRAGNTYLLNLTYKTPIETNLTLEEIFYHAEADFKLYVKDAFVCFSPERFVEIRDNSIMTYPMKGTIDASLPRAKEQILANEKEMAEHTMIVDLMRNDLSRVGSEVTVEKFRYLNTIKAGEKELLQVSSKISAKLTPNWHENLGEILQKLLPAGSISGTPKKRTVEIIEAVEDFERSFYTGIFGLYDGSSLDTAVMIRFIEQEQGAYYYKSGGGITLNSEATLEYQELLDKIYLPI
jgi:para-aminobenzoate synthetase component 1